MGRFIFVKGWYGKAYTFEGVGWEAVVWESVYL